MGFEVVQGRFALDDESGERRQPSGEGRRVVYRCGDAQFGGSQGLGKLAQLVVEGVLGRRLLREHLQEEDAALTGRAGLIAEHVDEQRDPTLTVARISGTRLRQAYRRATVKTARSVRLLSKAGQ